MRSRLLLLSCVASVASAFADVPQGDYNFRRTAPARRKIDGQNTFFKSCGGDAVNHLKKFARALNVRLDGKAVVVNSQEWLLKSTTFMGVAHERDDYAKERFEISFNRRDDEAYGFAHFTRLNNGHLVCADSLYISGTFTKL